MANRPNYVQQMDALLAGLAGSRPRLLLHACCGPCSSAVLELLCRHFDVTVLYYNPNIWPAAEYRRRADELARFLAQARPLGATLVEDRYDPAEFYAAVQGLEAEPEKGSRCTVCYRLRMERAAQYAAQNGFEWFTTTLSISPLKDAVRLNQIGQELAEQYGLRHLTSEFKKRDGYKRSLELSAQYGLYRQAYCGCEFSARGR
ncbi:MAG: epoxyqueuosine reductase QueH, partial [Oscillospiraceae bacterium]|nr:epoxyqueuosine reductase QueH [Oscillospiraceae bacterium]